MQIYRCKVRLAGDLRNEVRKREATAPEIMILRRIHGHDAVVDISHVRSDKRQHSAERARLAATYRPKIVESLFGPAHQPLPDALPEIGSGRIDDEDAEDKPRRGRKAKQDDSAVQPETSGADILE